MVMISFMLFMVRPGLVAGASFSAALNQASSSNTFNGVVYEGQSTFHRPFTIVLSILGTRAAYHTDRHGPNRAKYCERIGRAAG